MRLARHPEDNNTAARRTARRALHITVQAAREPPQRNNNATSTPTPTRQCHALHIVVLGDGVALIRAMHPGC